MYTKLPFFSYLLTCTFFFMSSQGEEYNLQLVVKSLSDNDNMYQFQWNLNPHYHGQKTLYFKLNWNESRLACLNHQSPNCTAFTSWDDNHYEMELKPYTTYDFQMIVFNDGLYQNESTRSENVIITTHIDDTILNEELPIITRIQPDKTGFIVHFDKMDCQNLNGPLYLNHQAIAKEHWCDSHPLTNESSRQFSFDTIIMSIPSLTPYCNYNVTIYVSRKTDNLIDWWNAKGLKSFRNQTKGKVIANPVDDLTVPSKGNDHVWLRWKLNPSPNGELKEHKIMIHQLPSGGSYNYTLNATSVKNSVLWPGYQCHKVIHNNWRKENKYNISIVSVNSNNLIDTELKKQIECAYKNGLFRGVKVLTKESKPEKPLNVRISWNNPNELNVSWNHPYTTNGYLKKFNITKTIRINSKWKYRTDALQINGENDFKYEYYKLTSFSVDPLQHLEALQVFVAACNSDSCSEYSSPYEPGPPKPLEYKGNIKTKGLALYIQKPSFDAFFDKLLIFKAILNTEKEKTDFEWEIKDIVDRLGRGEPGYSNGYIINKLLYEVNQKNIIPHIITLGGTNNTFQNGTTYNISIFVVNKLGDKRVVRTTIKEITFKLPDYNSKDLILIWLGILIFVLTTIFVVFVIFRYRHKLFVPNRVLSDMVIYSGYEDVRPLTFTEDQIEEEINRDTQREASTELIKPIHSKRIKTDDLKKYIKTSLETEELHRQIKLFPKSEVLMQRDPRFTCYFGSLPQNRPKNRYNSIIAYDHSRVKLSKLPGDDFSDYINANYVDGYKMPRAYIATQGPQKNTLNDFWRMVWEQNVKHIVMLNKLFVGDRKECEKYWPEVNEKLKFDQILVEHINVTRHTTYDVRNLKMYFKGTTKQVSHIQFKCWSEKGQPLYAQTLVPLLQKLLTLPYSGRTPILVHCSAGTGRTGTIILCDICLRMASVENAVDFLGFLERLRSQRPNMVNNNDQYRLAHLAVFACLKAWDTSIPCDTNFEANIEKLLEDGVVQNVMWYLRDSEWQDNAMKPTAVPHQVPLETKKNRYEDIVPEVPYQVFLQPWPGQAHAYTYVNAIRVNSFKFSDRFIVTQHPMPNTLEDFWRMVVEQDCTVLINLNEVDPDDKTSVPFWPEEDSEIDLEESINIRHVKTRVSKEFNIITIIVCYRPNDSERIILTVEILHFKSWNRYSAVPENIDDFVSFVVDSAVICRKSHPVLVTCHDGATASGLYVALSNLIDEMKLEQKCDICKTVRTLRTCRKQFVNKEIQLGFLFDAAVFYHNSWGLYQDLEHF